MEDKEGQKELGSKNITGQKDKEQEVQRKEGKTTQKERKNWAKQKCQNKKEKGSKKGG